MWVKIDDKMHAHRKTRRVLVSHPGKRRDAAPMGIWLLAASWAGLNNTSGWVPEFELDSFDDEWESLVERLVKAEYWWPEERAGEPGYGFVNWHEYNDLETVTDKAGFAAHVRWHVSRGQVSDSCPHCQTGSDATREMHADATHMRAMPGMEPASGDHETQSANRRKAAHTEKTSSQIANATDDAPSGPNVSDKVIDSRNADAMHMYTHADAQGMRAMPQPEPEPVYNPLTTFGGAGGSAATSTGLALVADSTTAVAAAPTPKRRGTRLPTDWAPARSEANIDAEKGHTPEFLNGQLLQFRDYWTAKAGAGGTKLDWDATWRNWIRRSHEFTPAKPTRARTAGSLTEAEWQQMIERSPA